MLTVEQANALAAPFHPNDLEWKVLTSGDSNGRPWILVAPFVTARAIMNRFDHVFGVGGWSHSITPVDMGSMIVKERGKDVTVFLKGFSCTITAGGCSHTDAAGCSDVEPIKGGVSDALKRAAVTFGVGRYLYQIERSYAKVHPGGAYKCRDLSWDPPMLPDWALPDPSRKPYSVYDIVAPEAPAGARAALPTPAAEPLPLLVPGGVVVPDGVPHDFVTSVVDLIERPNADALLTGTLGNASKKLRTLGMTPVVAKSRSPIDLVNAILTSKAMILDAEQGRAAA